MKANNQSDKFKSDSKRSGQRRSFFLKRHIALVIGFISIIVLSKSLLRMHREQDLPYIFIPPPEQLKLMTFGYHEMIASSLWIRFLQDIEVCGKATVTRADHEKMLQGEDTHETENDKPKSNVRFETDEMDEALFAINDDEKVCQKGWSFRILDSVTELSPKFRPPYIAGATALSVLANDHEGAKAIFDKGIKHYPSDWLILYRAAYLYLYEMRDFQTAAYLLNKSSKHGAPSWVNSLASRLFTRLGQAQLGYTTLLEYYKTLTDEKRKAQVETRLRKLEATFRAEEKTKKNN